MPEPLLAKVQSAEVREFFGQLFPHSPNSVVEVTRLM